MKNLLLLIATLFAFNLNAQTQGTIIYQQKMKFDFNVPEGMEEQFKGMMASEQTQDYALFFTEKESLYRTSDGKASDLTQESSSDDGSASFKIVIQIPDEQSYKNYETKQVVESKDFMGKKFLIKDELKKTDWKLTGGKKQIGEYVCHEATTMSDTMLITAYFAPQIPIAIGPESFDGLPGAILEVILDKGNTIITATEVKLGEVDTIEITPPSKGKKVSYQEYETIMEEKLKEFENMGGGTSIKIDMRG